MRIFMKRILSLILACLMLVSVFSGLATAEELTTASNEDYWDADNVFLETITYIYDAGEDPYSTIKGFEQGIYNDAALSASWEDYDKYVEKYKDNAYFSLPNSTSFGIVFNFNRQSFEETNYAEDSLRNINNFPAAGTQSDGTLYFDAVTKDYQEMTGEDIDLADGQDPFYNREAALEEWYAGQK